MSTHHLWWPKRIYVSEIAKKFRELKCNQAQTCRGFHDYIHLVNVLPEQPAEEEMRAVIEEEERKSQNRYRSQCKQKRKARQQRRQELDEIRQELQQKH